MTGFDTDAFLNTPFQGVTDTRRAICPANRYPAIITRLNSQGPKEEGQRPLLEVYCAPQGYQGPPVKYTCWLDVLPDGTLDPGDYKNGQLGQLRAAVNQNAGDLLWTPNMLLQQALMIEVTHRPYNGVMYDQVSTIAPMGAQQGAGAPPAAAAPAPVATQPVVAFAAPMAAQPPVAVPPGGNAGLAQPAAPAFAPPAPAGAAAAPVPAAPGTVPNAWGT